MLKIGLTGGIGSGKSSVSALFLDLGVPVIDMDVLAREVVMPGQPALQEIIRLFGEHVCDANGELKRRRVRDIIFTDPNKRRQLEAIIHPAIREQVRRRLNNMDSPYCIIVIPLLFETGQKDMIDRILVVDSRPEDQLQRTMRRDNISKDDVQNIMATQVSRQTRLELADDIINNSEGIPRLKEQVQQLHQHYLELCRSSTGNA